MIDSVEHGMYCAIVSIFINYSLIKVDFMHSIKHNNKLEFVCFNIIGHDSEHDHKKQCYKQDAILNTAQVKIVLLFYCYSLSSF